MTTYTPRYGAHCRLPDPERTINPMGGIKANPWIIVRAHYHTYVDTRDGRRRWQDWVTFAFLPVAVLAGCLAGDVTLSTAASAGLLTVSGLLSVFLFGVIVQVSQRAIDYAESRPTPGRETSAHADDISELAANAGYTSLVCIVAAVVFVVASIGSGWVLRISTAVGLALGIHMVMVLFMVMKREFALTQERLNRARTGADRTDRPLERAS
jgi:hypothetical protein